MTGSKSAELNTSKRIRESSDIHSLARYCNGRDFAAGGSHSFLVEAHDPVDRRKNERVARKAMLARKKSRCKKVKLQAAEQKMPS